MRRELEIRQMEYGATIARAQDHLDQLTHLSRVLHDLSVHLDKDDVSSTALEGLRVLGDCRAELDDAIKALCSALQHRGVTYRRMAESLGVAHNTVRLWVENYRNQYERNETH